MINKLPLAYTGAPINCFTTNGAKLSGRMGKTNEDWFELHPVDGGALPLIVFWHGISNIVPTLVAKSQMLDAEIQIITPPACAICGAVGNEVHDANAHDKAYNVITGKKLPHAR